LNGIRDKIADATKDAMANPQNKEKKKYLDSLLNQAEAANRAIADAAERARNPNKRLNNVADSMKKRMSLVPQQMDWKNDNRNNNNPIMAAAKQINLQITRGPPPELPEQKELVELAKYIAEEMAALSLAAQQGRKRDMIAAAKKIADTVNKVQSLSTIIANKCADPVLKKKSCNAMQSTKELCCST